MPDPSGVIGTTRHPSRRRRQPRRPAGWLLVQVDEGGLDRLVTGRLVDTSEGGLGLFLDRPLPEGSRVRVTRSVDQGSGDSPSWERREARVAYATSLPE